MYYTGKQQHVEEVHGEPTRMALEFLAFCITAAAMRGATDAML